MSGPSATPTAPRADQGTVVPALYACEITHVRSTPLRHRFAYGGSLWLVDVDDLPRLPRPLRALARFEAADHLGDPGRSIRANVDAFLAGRGVDLAGGRVLMLAQARVLGYSFNPLSVFWCHDGAGRLVCVLAEVCNTYGERHVYLLHTDEAGRAATDKVFYVSPFHPVDGRYTMRLPEPADRLSLSVTLHRPGARPFVAAVTGRRRPVTTGVVVRTALRHPWAPLAVTAKIRVQGSWLYLRGLPVVRRPPHLPQEDVQ